MRFFWFKQENNYGDVLTPYICRKLKVTCIWSPRPSATAIMVGSIANKARPGMHVFGSGFIRRNDLICRNAIYHWVRGPISRQMVLNAGGKAPEIYGDAALLMPEFVRPSEKVHDVGYIPHHVDYADLKQELKIDLTKGSIESITREITKYRRIISSSLHGIIVAHAYGIPAAWVKLSDKLTGDGMKFHDHYQSVGLKAQLSTIDNPIFQVPTRVETGDIARLICSQS